MKNRSFYCVYAAACAPEGGIFRYRLDPDGILTEEARVPLDCPMYFIKRGDVFHTLLNAPASLGGESGYVACRFGEPVPEPIPTGGKVACHLCEAGGRIYAVNYVSGSVSEIGGKTVTHAREMLGSEPWPAQTVAFPPEWQRQRLALQSNRQDAPHTHQIVPSPDGRFLLVADLGLDAVVVYDLELKLFSFLKMPLKSGVRHMVFGKKEKNGSYPLYCVCELDSTVCALRYRDGQLTFLGATDSHIARPDNTAAAIRLSSDGRLLFASHRGDDCVSVFRTEENAPAEWLFNAPCGGNGPRDFFLTPDDRFLICANERDGSLSVLLREENGLRFRSKVALPNALCVLAE